ncbi:unnamed protein product [Phytomonas sp. Hart1]|nr:unnamed protein product [Phytomonas sp. Hart1]|eukprot:CCW70995.1 unnamed protein product [Phytomonas sp. isolate Hart1]
MVVLARCPRSAEQTARLLLSNAFRYDTWECTAAKNEVKSLGGACTTVELKFHASKKQGDPVSSADEINLSLFDPAKGKFIGAGYRCGTQRLSEPIVFQSTPRQLLVVELIARDVRPNAPPEKIRVTHWAYTAIEGLSRFCSFSLRPGNAHLLLLDKGMWPAMSRLTAPASGELGYTCVIDSSPDLVRLMRELVPPGIFVSEAFTRATPHPEAKSFRLLVKNVELAATTKDSQNELSDPHTEWAIAAVAHNGYQQLGKGAEVSLISPQGIRSKTIAPGMDSHVKRNSPADSIDSYSYSVDSSYLDSTKDSSIKRQGNMSDEYAVLHSDIPLEFSGLPVHSTTSLVIAIRYRKPGDHFFKVAGFCVFPLCLMPMENRDIRVENLPALRGPFSCEDARMLMMDSSTPYGRVPIAVTMTIEYHNIEVQPGLPKPLTAAAASSPKSSSVVSNEEGTKLSDDKGISLSKQTEDGRVAPVPKVGPYILSSSEKEGGEPSSGTVLEAIPTNVRQQSVLVPYKGTAAPPVGGDGIFHMLSSIMEELQKVRETQHHILQQTTGGGRGEDLAVLSPALLERRNQRLADDAIDLIDLVPRPVAISWAARRAIQEGQQPILHPFKGSILDDSTPAVGDLPASIFGIRFEGITLDRVVAMPANVCMMFSFGPLPYQQVGAMRTVSVDKNDVTESFKLYYGERAGFIWHEPIDSLGSVSMTKFKQRGGVLYVHVYDALEMFYIATAKLPLAHFVRPYRAVAGIVPMDFTLERNFSMTEKVIPPEIFPLMPNAGQLHLSLFCVGVGRGDADLKLAVTATLEEPHGGARLIVAKRLPCTDRLNNASQHHPSEENATVAARSPVADSTAHTGEAKDTASGLHWQRVGHLKKRLAKDGIGTLLPGVPAAHIRATQDEAEMEYRLRFAEKERDEAKSKAIAKALLNRVTVSHRLQVVAWRSEIIRTPFQNPHAIALHFFVEVVPDDVDVCTPIDTKALSFYLGPKERTEVPLVLRLSPNTSGGFGKTTQYGDTRHIIAKVYTEKRELVRWIDIYATLVAPIVDRRYEIFGPVGSEITKRLFSRVFNSSAFPIASSQKELLQRLEQMCGFVSTSREDTQAKTNALVDPITQSYITAWEEVSITTTIPKEPNQQRIEHITLFYDAAMTRVYETWELCVFPCQYLTPREIYWGQTAVLGFPAEGIDAMYCDEGNVKVTHAGSSFVLHITPREMGKQQLLLHMLQQNILKKFLLTVPVVYPTPTFTQVIELSQDDVRAPVFRRLKFTNHGAADEVFHVHHNYKYQLQINPHTFGLAPSDSQYISLQFDMLSLPPGQLEGRWPMWIFINDSRNKTVESYHLQVVLRAHPVAIVAPTS